MSYFGRETARRRFAMGRGADRATEGFGVRDGLADTTLQTCASARERDAAGTARRAARGDLGTPGRPGPGTGGIREDDPARHVCGELELDRLVPGRAIRS